MNKRAFWEGFCAKSHALGADPRELVKAAALSPRQGPGLQQPLQKLQRSFSMGTLTPRTGWNQFKTPVKRQSPPQQSIQPQLRFSQTTPWVSQQQVQPAVKPRANPWPAGPQAPTEAQENNTIYRTVPRPTATSFAPQNPGEQVWGGPGTLAPSEFGGQTQINTTSFYSPARYDFSQSMPTPPPELSTHPNADPAERERVRAQLAHNYALNAKAYPGAEARGVEAARTGRDEKGISYASRAANQPTAQNPILTREEAEAKGLARQKAEQPPNEYTHGGLTGPDTRGMMNPTNIAVEQALRNQSGMGPRGPESQALTESELNGAVGARHGQY